MHGYETHITVSADEPRLLRDDLPVWADENNLKFTHIKLPSGTFDSQPMLTYWQVGGLTDQLSRADEIREALAPRGIEVTRVKVEVSIEHSDVPSKPVEGCYFEHHVKVLIRAAQQLDGLRSAAFGVGGRLSRNARRTISDGSLERFVTLRSYDGSGADSTRKCQKLIDSITESGFEILEVENEYVLFDSNQQLDAGWLTKGERNVV